MQSLTQAVQFFGILMVELTLLFIGISAIIELIQQYLSEQTIRRWLTHKGIWGYLLGAGIGALTPFCACSTIPMTVGFLRAKAPFGPVMSFVVASPIINPIAIGMMATLLGLKAGVIYSIVSFVAAVGFGMLLNTLGFGKLVKNVVVTGGRQNEIVGATFSQKLQFAFQSAWQGYRKVFVFLVIGVAIGAFIKGYVPAAFIARTAGPENPLAVPVAALIGVPLYIRASTAIPIGLALMGKGMSVGAVIALIIGGAGMAIPEMSLLAGIFKTRLVAAIVLVIFTTAVAAGLVFNIV